VLEQARPGDTTLLTGDWNACLHEGDRLGEPTTQDRDYRRWASSHPLLRSVYGEGQRRPTFSAGGMGASPSMIDDTLVLPPVSAGRAAAHLVAGCDIQQHGWSTFHALLSCEVDKGVAGVEVPAPQPAARPALVRKLVLPVTEEERQGFQRRDGFLTISHTPLNPHTDVAASGRISVEVRQVQAQADRPPLMQRTMQLVFMARMGGVWGSWNRQGFTI
jgi:hypothetical protein